MSLKWTAIISAVWLLVIMLGCLAFLASQAGNSSQRQLEARASALGRGAGIVAAITLVPLWGYWALQHRKRSA